jgi:hypothetical protein
MLAAAASVLQRAVIDESPYESVERPPFALDRERRFGILNRRLDLQTIAHNARVLEQRSDISRGECCQSRDMKTSECPPVRGALAKDGRPAQAGLSALEHEEFEQPPVAVFGHAPLLVVIALHQDIVLRP